MIRNLSQLKCYAFALLLLFSTILTSCITRDDDGPKQINDPLDPGSEVTATLGGTVVDENGKPLEGVTISVHGETTTTSADGAYLLEDIKVPGNRVVVSASKEGYFNSVKGLDPNNSKNISTQLVLMNSEITHTIDAATGGKATLDNGSLVEIPANGVVTSSGEVYTGEINMTVRYLNPVSDAFGTVVPGGDMLAQRTDESTSILYSYGILRVLLKSTDGDALQIAPGKTSTITMAIPSEQLATAPATIPLWYLDEEKGYWVEEGSAEKKGNIYVGTVKHFTDWNCDDPKEWATIIGRLVDCNSRPSGGLIGFGQETSDIVADTDASETTGKFEMRVPVGITIPVVIHNPLSIPHLDKDASGKVIVIVPPLSAGQVYDVGDLQPFPCTSTVKGSFKSSKGEKVKSMSFESQNGSLSVKNSSQTFSINGFPAETQVKLTIKTESGKTITKEIKTAAPSSTLDLGEIVLDVDVSLSENSFIIDGDGFTNKKYTIQSQFTPKGWFMTKENLTQIRIGGSGEEVEFSIQFEGNSLSVTKAAASSLQITDSERGMINYYSKSSSPIQITITRYDLVGGLIEGKYSGTYQRWENNKPIEVNITEGKFSVTRVNE